jgi:uncharacterized damage-inducible protein DinB
MIDITESAMGKYLVDVPVPEIPGALFEHQARVSSHLAGLPESMADHAYAPGKWTVRQLVGHILVANRIFMTRAICIARGETQPLPGFDENVYAENWPRARVPLALLAGTYAAEAKAVQGWVLMLEKAELSREGTANGILLKPEQLLRALIGHESHHLKVLSERYGLGPK